LTQPLPEDVLEAIELARERDHFADDDRRPDGKAGHGTTSLGGRAAEIGP
jgi:hypothetical protein